MGERLGGRTKGTPNKATAKVKEFLDKLFEQAFANPAFEQRLLRQMVSGKMDTKLFTVLLAYYAGRPAVAVEHQVTGTLTLAELIVGATPPTEDEEPPDAADE